MHAVSPAPSFQPNSSLPSLERLDHQGMLRTQRRTGSLACLPCLLQVLYLIISGQEPPRAERNLTGQPTPLLPPVLTSTPARSLLALLSSSRPSLRPGRPLFLLRGAVQSRSATHTSSSAQQLCRGPSTMTRGLSPSL